MKSFNVVFLALTAVGFIATPSFASSKAANEIIGKSWREACERKKKEQSFNWETTYECCKMNAIHLLIMKSN